MSRPLRHFKPGAVVEITTRTIQGRFLLRPSPKLTKTLTGILARALARYGLLIHAFFFASNHYHLIVTIPDVRRLALFMNYVNGNVAREAGRRVGWKDKFWCRRYRSIEILDDEAQVERLEYVLSHGCKEGLVAHPREWPGATCGEALLDGVPVQGIWFDRTALYYARRRGKQVSEDDFAQEVEFELAPLPCWANLEEGNRRQRIAEMVTNVVEKTKIKMRTLGRKAIGVKAVLAVDPHSHPESPKRSPAPRCHTTCPERWADFVARTREFVSEYREAAALWLRGESNVVFPPDCFLPPMTYAAIGDPALVPT